MPGLVPGIHVFDGITTAMDGRDKPGHDGNLPHWRSVTSRNMMIEI
jgi:hypothetical protein